MVFTFIRRVSSNSDAPVLVTRRFLACVFTLGTVGDPPLRGTIFKGYGLTMWHYFVDYLAYFLSVFMLFLHVLFMGF